MMNHPLYYDWINYSAQMQVNTRLAKYQCLFTVILDGRLTNHCLNLAASASLEHSGFEWYFTEGSSALVNGPHRMGQTLSWHLLAWINKEAMYRESNRIWIFNCRSVVRTKNALSLSIKRISRFDYSSVALGHNAFRSHTSILVYEEWITYYAHQSAYRVYSIDL